MPFTVFKIEYAYSWKGLDSEETDQIVFHAKGFDAARSRGEKLARQECAARTREAKEEKVDDDKIDTCEFYRITVLSERETVL